MTKDIIVTQGDYGICIQSQFMQDKKTAQNITGYTVELTTVTPDLSKLYRTAQIIDAVNGIVEYILNEEDTTQSGLYKMYFELLDDNENITAQNMVTYYVLAKHGGVE
jgi:hypothetical protein